MTAWTATSAGGRRAFVSAAGRVEQVRVSSWFHTARWTATRPDGSPVRVDVNRDGSPYTPRAWHSDAERPAIRYFPDARLARFTLERLEAVS